MASGRAGIKDHVHGVVARCKERLIDKITITIPLPELNKQMIADLSVLTKEHPGNTELYFR
jgi:hypothetical protein